MRRKNPLYSLSGILLTLVFISVLSWSLWHKGGLAFNPGPLTAINSTGKLLQGYYSHADLESECSRCHQPLSSSQATLCLDCHSSVERQIKNNQDLHGKISAASSSIPVDKCHACHRDHRGSDFSPAETAWANFEHAITGFSLSQHQFDYDATPLECRDCHDSIPSNEDDINPKCDTCHTTRDQAFMNAHRDEFGDSCTDCHDGADSMADFDHQQSKFPLQDRHAQLLCTACHLDATSLVGFEGTSARCAGCHAEPGLHAGLFSTDCQNCHTAQAWSPAMLDGISFDHANQVRFSLVRHQKNYDGAPLTCSTCHLQDLATSSAETCIDCHQDHDTAFMDDHLTRFGSGCLDCHDGIDRMHNFDHNQVYVLNGRHAEIECQACHGLPPQPGRYAGTPSACADCHAEPEIHAGVFGLECQSCHRADAWTPALLLNHSFPLDHGGQGIVACQVCHPASYVEYTCYGCHEHNPAETIAGHQEEGISALELPDCTRCHPTGLEDEWGGL